jgi:phosphoribosylformylglycinamidine (FGAM) synthase-like amidotransferase family enzyme
MSQLQEAEDKLAKGSAFPKQDSDYHSQRFEYITIQNSQTIFFERMENDIIIVAVGWSGRNWKARLDEMQPYIDRQLEKLKRLQER